MPARFKAKSRRFDIARLPRHRQTRVLVYLLLGSILLVLLLRSFVIRSMIVDGDSMAPTLHPNRRVFVLPWAYRSTPPQRGDLVAIRLPGEREPLVKRIVALPGEYFQIRNNRVYVNRTPLQEPYLPAGVDTPPGRLYSRLYRVAPDSYFVLGDNRRNSFDSRNVGAIPGEMIIGKVW